MRENNKEYVRRFVILMGVVMMVMVAYIMILMRQQLVDGDQYKSEAIKYTATSLSVTAARGEIVDRYGRSIAENRMGYSIIFNRAEMDKEAYNDTIWKLTRILESNGEEWIDNCPIVIQPSGYPEFVEGEESAISKMKAQLNLQSYATAQNCLDTMYEKYELNWYQDNSLSNEELEKLYGSDYASQLGSIQQHVSSSDVSGSDLGGMSLRNQSTEVARVIMGVRLNMELMEFSNSNPYIFAEDVSLETVEMVAENHELLQGVEIQVVPIREYTNGTVAPHLIGNTGPIYAEEYEELKQQGYSINATIGKFGIEKTYESYLKGTNGIRKIQRDDTGEIVYEEITRKATPGNTVVLTIDSELQKAAQDSLGTVIRSIAARGGFKTGIDADAGAVVVMNVRTFEVLAAVTYPSFDLALYGEKYSELLADKAAPLFNRVLNGTYAPGSTFKPAVALAGLQEGKEEERNDVDRSERKGITPDTTFDCIDSTAKGRPGYGEFSLEQYENFTLYCLHEHGKCDVVKAIGVSCNIFFYATGYRLGITRMNDYCKQLGLGVATGIGMGESKGILAGREEREAQELGWYEADTLTAAIGQNDNKFTPMQLCAYISTIANGGTRYEARIVKTIKSYDMSDTIVEDTSDNPVVYNELNVDTVTINTVKEGMRAVTEDGTAAELLADYEIAVGGKTGTADTTDEATANALFIAFAPFDEPEIGVAIIGERCGYGSYMVQVARDIFDEYFYSDRTAGYLLLDEGGLVDGSITVPEETTE